jgi:predicted GNAT family N-acyltransferase
VIVELFGIEDSERMKVACDIRTRVFVFEQGVPLEEEIDVHDTADRDARHALAYGAPGAAALGAGRYYSAAPGVAQIGRLAVLAPARGTGVGAALLEALVAEARRRGFVRARLDAQTHARGFYLKHGFRDDGDRMWDAGIEHQPMSKVLLM